MTKVKTKALALFTVIPLLLASNLIQSGNAIVGTLWSEHWHPLV